MAATLIVAVWANLWAGVLSQRGDGLAFVGALCQPLSIATGEVPDEQERPGPAAHCVLCATPALAAASGSADLPEPRSAAASARWTGPQGPQRRVAALHASDVERLHGPPAALI